MKSALKYWVIISLSAVILIDTMGLGLIYPILPKLFLDETNLSIFSHPVALSIRDFYYGLSFAVFPMGSIFGMPLLGDLSDKYGRKPLLLLSLLGIAASYLACAFAINYKFLWVFLLGRFLQGFFAASQVIALAAIADVSASTEDKMINMRWSYLMQIIGFALGPIVAAFAIQLSSELLLDAPFWIACGMSFINAVMLQVSLKESYITNISKKINFTSIFFPARFIFADKRTRAIGLIYLFYQLSWGGYIQSIGLILGQFFHATQNTISLFFIVSGVALALSIIFLYPQIIKKFDNIRILISLSFLTILLMSFILYSNNLKIQIILGSLLGVISVMFCIGLMALLSSAVNTDEQGKAMGGSGFVFSAAWLTSALAITVLIINSYREFYFIVLVFAVITAIILYLHKKLLTKIANT